MVLKNNEIKHYVYVNMKRTIKTIGQMIQSKKE